MGPLSAEVGQGIRTKGQRVSRMQNKRAGNAVSVHTLLFQALLPCRDVENHKYNLLGQSKAEILGW